LTSDYEGLRRDFDVLRTSHDAIVKEKADMEKTEREKVYQLQNSLRKKLAELRVDMEATVASLGGGVMHGFSLCQHYCQ
jgi:3-dehydroquinate synthetase